MEIRHLRSPVFSDGGVTKRLRSTLQERLGLSESRAGVVFLNGHRLKVNNVAPRFFRRRYRTGMDLTRSVGCDVCLLAIGSV